MLHSWTWSVMMNNRDITDIMCIATVTCILGDACVLLLNMILCWHIYSRIASPWYWLWLTDLHWVRALTVPMHLGLIDGPFVPHNLLTAQESLVPIPKFQMVPRLKILISSGSKKGTQIYYPFLSKVLASESPPGFPTRPLWRKMPVSRAFLNVSSRVPSKGTLPRVPPHWSSSEGNAPFLEPPSSISQSPW